MAKVFEFDYSKETDEAIRIIALDTLNSLNLPKAAKDTIVSTKLSSRDDMIQFVTMNRDQSQMIKNKQLDKDSVINNLRKHVEESSIPTISEIQELYQNIKDQDFGRYFVAKNGLDSLFALIERIQTHINMFKGLPTFHEQCQTERQTNIKNWTMPSFDSFVKQPLVAQLIDPLKYKLLTEYQQIIYKCIQIIRILCDNETDIVKMFKINNSSYIFFKIFYESWMKEIREEILYMLTTICLLPIKFHTLDYLLVGLDWYAVNSNTSRFTFVFNMADYYIRSLKTENISNFMNITHEFNVVCYLVIIFMCYLDKKYNPSLRARKLIREQFNKCNFLQFNEQLEEYIITLVRQILKQDSMNLAQELKQLFNSDIKNLDVSLLVKIQDFISSDDCVFEEELLLMDSTGDSKKYKRIISQLTNLLKNYRNIIQSKLWDDQLSQSFIFQHEENGKQLLSSLPDQLAVQFNQITAQSPTILRNYATSILRNLLLIAQHYQQNTLDETIVGFSAVNSFTTHVVEQLQKFTVSSFSSEIFERSKYLENAFNQDIYDAILNQKFKTNYAEQVSTLEYVFGCSVQQLIQQHKHIVDYKSDICDDFQPRGCLRAVSSDLHERMQKFQLVLEEKEQIIKELELQIKGGNVVRGIQSVSFIPQEANNQSLITSQIQDQPMSSSLSAPPTLPPPLLGSLPSSLTNLPAPPNIQNLPVPSSLSGLSSLPPPPCNSMSLSGLPLPPTGLPGMPKPPGGLPGIPLGLPTIGLGTVPTKRMITNHVPSDKKMRAFFWDKVKENDLKADSLWNDIGKCDLELETDIISDIVSQFSDQKKMISDSKPQETEVKSKLITVIDGKRSQQIGIMLQKLKMSPEQIMLHILQLKDISPLDPGIETLLAACPLNEDFDAMKTSLTVEPNLDRYMKPEIYTHCVSVIPKLQTRLQNWLYMKNYTLDLAGMKPVFLITNKFFEFINENKAWKQLLWTLLTFGNIINSGTPRGDSYGFKLKSLTKFIDVKDCSSKSNLLNYIIRYLKKKDSKADEQIFNRIDLNITQLQADALVQLDIVNEKYPILPMLQILNIIITRFKRQNFVEESQDFEKFYNKLSDINQTKSTFQTALADDYYTQFVDQFFLQAFPSAEKVNLLFSEAKEKFAKAQTLYLEPTKTKFDDFIEYFFEFNDSVQAVLTEIRKEDEEASKEAIKEITAGKHKVKKEKKVHDEEQIIMDVDCTSLMDNLMNNFVEGSKKPQKQRR